MTNLSASELFMGVDFLNENDKFHLQSSPTEHKFI
jgi:hypothetical protein